MRLQHACAKRREGATVCSMHASLRHRKYRRPSPTGSQTIAYITRAELHPPCHAGTARLNTTPAWRCEVERRPYTASAEGGAASGRAAVGRAEGSGGWRGGAGPSVRGGWGHGRAGAALAGRPWRSPRLGPCLPKHTPVSCVFCREPCSGMCVFASVSTFRHVKVSIICP